MRGRGRRDPEALNTQGEADGNGVRSKSGPLVISISAWAIRRGVPARFSSVRSSPSAVSRSAAACSAALGSISGRVCVTRGRQRRVVARSGESAAGLLTPHALLATVTTREAAPVIVAQRLRRGACGSPRGAHRLVADALAEVKNLCTDWSLVKPLLHADSAFYGHPTIAAAIKAGAEVSVTVRLDKRVKGRDPLHPRRRLAEHRVHRRGLRPGHRPVDLTGRNRGDRLHRIHLQEEGRACPGPTGGQADPGPEPQRRARPGQVVRHLAVPRVLHHQRPRHAQHHGRGQDPPRSRDHRTGPRRPEELGSPPPPLSHPESAPRGEGLSPSAAGLPLLARRPTA